MMSTCPRHPALDSWGDFDRDDPFPLFAEVRSAAPVHEVRLSDGQLNVHARVFDVGLLLLAGESSHWLGRVLDLDLDILGDGREFRVAIHTVCVAGCGCFVDT